MSAAALALNAASFALVDAALLRSLPYPAAGRLVEVFESTSRGPAAIAPANWAQWKDGVALFETTAAWEDASAILKIDGDFHPEPAVRATSHLPALVGAQVQIGRTLVPADDTPGSEPVAVIPSALAIRYFGVTSASIGKPVVIGDVTHTIVGVVADTVFPPGSERAPIFSSFQHPADVKQGSMRYLRAIAKLNAHANIDQANLQLGAGAGLRSQAALSRGRPLEMEVAPLSARIPEPVKEWAIILYASSVVLLLIVGINIAILIATEGAKRRYDWAIHLALGGSNGSLTRQTVLEVAVLGLLAVSLGLFFARASLDQLQYLLGPAWTRLRGPISVNTAVVVGTLISALPIFCLCAYALVRAASSIRPAAVLKSRDGHMRARRSGDTVRGAYLATQIALVLPLLICSTLLLKSYSRLAATDLGADLDGLVTFDLALEVGHANHIDSLDLAEAINKLPGVDAVAAAAGGRLLTPASSRLAVTFIEGDDPEMVETRWISPGYFDTLGIRVLKGRPLIRQEARDGAQLVIINEAAADRWWGDQDPIGQLISVQRKRFTIIGVVSSLKHHGPASAAVPELFFSLAHLRGPATTLIVRVRATQQATIDHVKRAIRDISPSQQMSRVQTASTAMASILRPRRMTAVLLSSYAAVSFAVVIAGIYANMGIAFSQRQKEIGIRMAIGATRLSVAKLLLLNGARWVAIGGVIGLALFFGTARWIQKHLFEVSSNDFDSVITSAAAVLIAALSACLVQAIRVTRVDLPSWLREI